MSAKLYANILKAGIFLSFLSLFFVFDSFLFPYITSKQIFFNILIEILMVFWVMFMIKFPKYRPKKSWLNKGILIYFLLVLVSVFFSVDPGLSFWGDAERMLGWFHLAHFLAFYFIVITAFRTKRDWKHLISASVLVAVILSLKGIIDNKPDLTLGNRAYVGVLMIFNIGFAAWGFLKEKTHFKWLYVVAMIPLVISFYEANITGAFLGMGAGIFSFLVLLAVFYKQKMVKIVSSVLSIALVAFLVFVFTFNSQSWIQNSVLSEFSWQTDTLQTRLISWQAALQDFSNHPIIGTGHGTYASTFDKHFTSEFYEHATTGTYFDRAHNNVVEVISTKGILGIISYLSIFVFVAIYLLRENKKYKQAYADDENKDKYNNRVLELIILASIIIAYFVQNLALFDALASYIPLFITLGYIYHLYFNIEEKVDNTPAISSGKEISFLVLIALVMTLVLYNFNIRPVNMFNHTISGYSSLRQGEIETGVDEYQQAFKASGILQSDSRKNFLNNATNALTKAKDLSRNEVQELISLVDKSAEYIIELNPENTSNNLIVSQAYLKMGRIHSRHEYSDQADKFYDKSLKYINQAIESSPKRANLYFSKGELLFRMNQPDKGFETFKQGLELNPDYAAAHCYMYQAYYLQQKPEEGKDYLDTCVEEGGIANYDNAVVINEATSRYAQNEEYDKAFKVAKKLDSSREVSYKFWYFLAQNFYQQDKYEKAQEANKRALQQKEDFSPAQDLQSKLTK